jgi:hypothetical protein
MSVIFQNSKCIIRTVESYGSESFPIPDEIKHLTCGIVPHVLDQEGIGGFLFLTLYGEPLHGKLEYFFDGPSPSNLHINIYGCMAKVDAKKYVLGLVEDLIEYGLCFGPTKTTMDQVEERAREIVKTFELYE